MATNRVDVVQQFLRHLLEATELSRKKAEISRLRARYERLFNRQQPIRDAVEMAQLDEYLDRVFEARVFLTLAMSAAPERKDLRRDLERLSQSSRKVANDGKTLADVLTPAPGNDGNINLIP